MITNRTCLIETGLPFLAIDPGAFAALRFLREFCALAVTRTMLSGERKLLRSSRQYTGQEISVPQLTQQMVFAHLDYRIQGGVASKLPDTTRVAFLPIVLAPWVVLN